MHSRREILTEYLNRAPFGGNLVGAEAASQFYFHCACSQLSLAQAALLAGLPQSPNRLRPDRFPARARKRRDHVLDQMLTCGLIDRKQFDEAMREPISVATERRDGIGLANGALPTLVSFSQNSRGGIIAISLDSGIQQTALHNAQQGLNELSSNGIDSIAVIVLDTANAQCLAAVSLGPKGSKIDLTRRPRSTGSTLKPLIYAAAFDAGICTPDTILNDAPSAWAGYAPSDYDKEFKGPISAAHALAESRNIPALCVLKEICVEPAIEIMQAAGLRSLGRQPARYGLSLAIGGAEATPMEIAEAYATLARGGIARHVKFSPTNSTPYILLSSEGRRILRESACWQTMTALSEFDRTAAVCREGANRHVAWKTGTSSGHRDAWCAAATRSYTVVVWLGNETGSGSSSLVGAEAAAPIALRLISSFESSVNRPWPVSAAMASNPMPTVGSDQLKLPRLTLMLPSNGQIYLLDDAVPLDHQRVAMKAVSRGETPGRRIWWFVDGAAIGAGESGKTNWWTPTRGSHEIRAVDESGRSASATIDVR
jgi:penicillin-binding protein 1C